MAQLAIFGHATRGKEVIKILEMLGGENPYAISTAAEGLLYRISNYDNRIVACSPTDTFVVFTLEEFLEKFPYKVGNKVIYEGKRRKITNMVWEEQTNTVAYKLDDKLYCNVIDELQPYKELIMPLKDYTDEELRNELKRRAQERRKSRKHEIKYIDFEATIIGIDNTQGYKANGDIEYKPFVLWKYKVNNRSYEFAERNNYIDEFYLKQGCFNRDNAPHIGDKVRLRYRRTKGYEIFDLRKAKIIEIINQ